MTKCHQMVALADGQKVLLFFFFFFVGKKVTDAVS